MDERVREARARYADARAATARRLYAAHKLAGEAERQRAIARASRDAARAALEARDTRRSRSMVAAARTALDLAGEAEQAHRELRAHADAALEDLRRLASALAGLEREHLRAVATSGTALAEAQRALDLFEAERELEAELS